jgi:hypothetical protein
MMLDPAASPFPRWENFYVIVGSSGAALTGLQFVVMALIADAGAKTGGREIAAFGTPTVVHFCAALLVSTIVSAPWQTLTNPAFAIGALGASGTVYAVVVTLRARAQTGYKPVFEDWLWHSILPFCSYAAILVASLLLRHTADDALFLVGASALMLLIVGIHNAWDTVTFITLTYRAGSDESDAA